MPKAKLLTFNIHDTLDYQKTNASRFPILATIARRYLQIPTTSAPIESSFSIRGLIISKIRNKLFKDVFKLIACLKSQKFIEEEEEDESFIEDFLIKLVVQS